MKSEIDPRQQKKIEQLETEIAQWESKKAEARRIKIEGTFLQATDKDGGTAWYRNRFGSVLPITLEKEVKESAFYVDVMEKAIGGTEEPEQRRSLIERRDNAILHYLHLLEMQNFYNAGLPLDGFFKGCSQPFEDEVTIRAHLLQEATTKANAEAYDLYRKEKLQSKRGKKPSCWKIADAMMEKHFPPLIQKCSGKKVGGIAVLTKEWKSKRRSIYGTLYRKMNPKKKER